MAGVDTILRLLLGTMTLIALLFIGAVGVSIIGPIFNAVPAAPASLGWPGVKGTVFRFFTLGMVGLMLVVIIWWWFSPVKQDVRQNQQGPF